MTEPKAILDGHNICLELPNHALFVGATMSGKTTLCLNLLQQPHLFHPPPSRILFYFDQYQDKYCQTKEHLAELGIDLKLYKGFPDDLTLDNINKIDGQTLILVDDFSEQASSSAELARIATNGRHKNISLWIVLHSLFNKSSESRTISQNMRWFFLLPSLRLESQLRTFGAQLGLRERLIFAFKSCQEDEDPFCRYILIDSGPRTPDILRIRSHIHHPNKQYCYT